MDLGIHLTWTYASIFTKWLNSCFKIKTATGEIKETKIKISDGSAFFPFFTSLYILKSLIDKNDYKEISFSDIIGGIKQESSYSTLTLQGTINFNSIEISSGYKIDDEDLSTFIDFGTAYNSEKDFTPFLGLNYKTNKVHIAAPKWNSQYVFEGQEYNISQYQDGGVNNLKLVKKDCIPIQPNSIFDTELDVSKWSRGKIFQNRLAHMEETYYIYKDIDSSGNTVIKIKEQWKEQENGKNKVNTNITQYALKTSNLILDIQAPGGKGADGTQIAKIAAGGGGGGAFCRLIINLDLTTEDEPYKLILAACTTEENQSPNYCEFGLYNGIYIRLQSGYNGVTTYREGADSVLKSGEGGKVYTTLLAPGPGRKWEQLKPETNFNYQNYPPCITKTYTDNIMIAPIKDMILLSYAAGKSQTEGNFSSKDALCNGTSSTFPFFNEDNKRGYSGKTMKQGGGGGGASVLGYGQRGRSLGESMDDYDTDWFAYGGGGGGGVSSIKQSERTYGTFGQPGCFIVYGLGDEIPIEKSSN